MRKVQKCFGQKRVIALLSSFIFFSDQLSKFFVVKFFEIGEICAITPFFNITRVHNSGVSFGMLDGAVHPLILVLLSSVVVILLLTLARKDGRLLLPISMVVSGALGNIVDRVLHGFVIDFLDFYVSRFHWPAFNIADCAIVIGASILFFISYSKEEKV